MSFQTSADVERYLAEHDIRNLAKVGAYRKTVWLCLGRRFARGDGRRVWRVVVDIP